MLKPVSSASTVTNPASDNSCSMTVPGSPLVNHTQQQQTPTLIPQQQQPTVYTPITTVNPQTPTTHLTPSKQPFISPILDRSGARKRQEMEFDSTFEK